jgi:glycosyltransferase involved in cell wall biosynthesis
VLLSILMPVYNEIATVAATIKRVLDVDYPCDVELVIVEDGSTDGTIKLLKSIDDPRISMHFHSHNQGKGAAIRTAAQEARGDYMIICDADLEYAPEDIPNLLQPVLDGDAEVVYGTRAFSSNSAYSFWYVMGNKGVTLAANILFDSYISDLETCFKLMPLSLYRELDITSAGFGMEAELTARLLARGIRPYEVPIHYKARSREDGKKLTWKDGVEALVILTRERFRARHQMRRPRTGAGTTGALH